MHVQLYNGPRSASGLPVTRNMPYSQSSMPSQSQPRNMTGIYLGLEGNLKPPRPKTGVPPLARSRGSSRMRTPTEEHRYRKVELLRLKEEKRGFSGNPVKRHQQTALVSSDTSSYIPPPTYQQLQSSTVGLVSCSTGESQQSRRWGPGKRIDPNNLDDLLRPNARHYTTVANSGVTRSEKLTGWPLGGQVSSQGDSTDLGGLGMAREVGRVTNDDLTGLEECFRTICKGNVDVLYSLLPGRKTPTNQRESTGFTVRSYRNPQQAEILADFSSHNLNSRTDRPKTVPIRRPIVPQPYFYRHYSTHPGAATIAAQRGYHSSAMSGDGDATTNYFHSTSRIMAAPGAGTISRSLSQRLRSAALTEPDLSRHSISPIGHAIRSDIKRYQSAASTNRTTANSINEEPIQSEESHEEQSAAGPAGSEVRVAVVPIPRALDVTTDSNTTLDSVTPRPPADTNPTPRSLADNSAAGDSATPTGEQKVDTENEQQAESVEESVEQGADEVPLAEEGNEEEAGASTEETQQAEAQSTASNSGADITIGLETDEGETAAVEIDEADQEELSGESPKGKLRKASITEKVSKTKASEVLAATIKEQGESRQREFEKLLDEHAEIVQETKQSSQSEDVSQDQDDQQ